MFSYKVFLDGVLCGTTAAASPVEAIAQYANTADEQCQLDYGYTAQCEGAYPHGWDHA